MAMESREGKEGDGPDVVQAGHALAAVYISVAALCLFTLAIRAVAAKFCGLPFHVRHVMFLALLLLLFVVRVVSDIWELGDGRLVAAGSRRWMYNLLSTGPVIVFMTIFLVLLYHLTCVLHSINLAKEGLEEAYFRSIAPAAGSERAASPRLSHRDFCFRCRGKAFLAYFKCFMILAAAMLWVLFIVGYVATLLVQDDDKQHVSIALTALVEAPIFVVCTLTGLGLFASAVQLLRRLRRLKLTLRNEQVIAALRAGVQDVPQLMSQSSDGSVLTRATAEVSESSGGSLAETPAVWPSKPSRNEASARCSGVMSDLDSTDDQAVASVPVSGSHDSFTSPTSTEVDAVLGSVFRVWAVVTSCVAAFLFRSSCILYLVCAGLQFWPCALLLPYYLVSEVAPAALLILLYLLPGIEAACAVWSYHPEPERSTCRPSMLESEVLGRSHLSLWLRSTEAPAPTLPLVDERAR
mmetsp:Transcript_5370/g.9583  ORF Transcript_5370/g.9583 Transcript_5370/m.9583 type:complete len:466 (+) Transcript_5370:31-1428(+)